MSSALPAMDVAGRVNRLRSSLAEVKDVTGADVLASVAGEVRRD